MTPCVLHITVDGDRLLGGPLWAEIKQEDSTWQISGGMLEFSLLKRSRRNNYANGHTNADTFWRRAVEIMLTDQLQGPAWVRKDLVLCAGASGKGRLRSSSCRCRPCLCCTTTRTSSRRTHTPRLRRSAQREPGQ